MSDNFKFGGFIAEHRKQHQYTMRQLADMIEVTAPTSAAMRSHVARQLKELGDDVEDRNARFFLEQEALLDAARLDLKAKYDAKIREYQAKEATANKEARKASGAAAEELKLKKEARQWRRNADDAEDEYRSERNRLRNESDDLLDSAQEALQAKESRDVLFTINWKVR